MCKCTTDMPVEHVLHWSCEVQRQAAILFAAYAPNASGGKKKKKCNRDLSFHFYDFPRILWRVWKDRHVYEGFQMVLLAPPAFLFSSWAMKD